MTIHEIGEKWLQMSETEREERRAFTSARLRKLEAALVITTHPDLPPPTQVIAYCPMLEALEKGVKKVYMMPFMPSFEFLADTDYEFLGANKIRRFELTR